MAALTAPQKAEVVRDFHRALSDRGYGCSITKAQVATFIDEVDAWRVANESEFNQAINATARAALSGKLKALGLMMVVEKNFEITP